MLLSDRPRIRYEHAPVHEVICQLRFPPILSINENEPAAFQETIRDSFPQYARRQDVPGPKVSGVGTPNIRVENQPPVTNYHFLSGDGKWKLNLTRDFIALSTLRYSGWEEFARRLDRPLAAFIERYQPAWFQRVGLRYRNLVFREQLGLEDTPWRDLFAPAYTGPLQEEDVREEDAEACVCDLTLRMDSSSHAKVHAGPARVRPQNGGNQADERLAFVFDLDLSMTGNTPCTLAAAALETLHGHANRVFEGAITDTLRDAIR